VAAAAVAAQDVPGRLALRTKSQLSCRRGQGLANMPNKSSSLHLLVGMGDRDESSP
jgi:hypothetical protein